MPRNITATQKRARDFYNQTKYGCFISHGTESTKNYFIKIYLFYISISQWKNSEKNKFSQVGALEEIFLSPEYPDFGFKF